MGPLWFVCICALWLETPFSLNVAAWLKIFPVAVRVQFSIFISIPAANSQVGIDHIRVCPSRGGRAALRGSRTLYAVHLCLSHKWTRVHGLNQVGWKLRSVYTCRRQPQRGVSPSAMMPRPGGPFQRQDVCPRTFGRPLANSWAHH